jgi:endogenous inhibitor of DNA gyrase (YacG/DUF329 family)
VIMNDRREKNKKRKRKKIVEFCLYCGINVVRKSSPYCCAGCERLDQAYKVWLANLYPEKSTKK